MTINISNQRIGRLCSKNRLRRFQNIISCNFINISDHFFNRNITVEQQQLSCQFFGYRRRSGDVSFSEAFPCIVTSPTYGQAKTLRIFVDRCSIEMFEGDGKMSMTNLVFPSEPYNKLIVKGKAKATIYKLKI